MPVAQDKTGVGAGSMEWRTPPELFAWLNRRFQVETKTKKPHKFSEPGEGPAARSVVAIFRQDYK